MEKGVWFKEVEGKRLYYVPIGAKDYLKPVYRLWIAPRFFNVETGYITFPINKADIKEAKNKDNLILTNGNKNLFIVEVEPGYRGSGHIIQIDTFGHEYREWRFPLYKSERGNKGIGEGALILTTAPKVRIAWQKDGKLYGGLPEGITIVYEDGREEELDFTDEDLDLLKNELGGEQL